eukprot:UN13272
MAIRIVYMIFSTMFLATMRTICNVHSLTNSSFKATCFSCILGICFILYMHYLLKVSTQLLRHGASL